HEHDPGRPDEARHRQGPSPRSGARGPAPHPRPRGDGQGDRGAVNFFHRHARPCAGHPRLGASHAETWMGGTSPAMTKSGKSDMTDEITIERAQELIDRGAYHRWLGIKVVAVHDDGIELTAKWREEWVVNPERKYTHGGVLAALIDLAADWAMVK